MKVNYADVRELKEQTLAYTDEAVAVMNSFPSLFDEIANRPSRCSHIHHLANLGRYLATIYSECFADSVNRLREAKNDDAIQGIEEVSEIFRSQCNELGALLDSICRRSAEKSETRTLAQAGQYFIVDYDNVFDGQSNQAKRVAKGVPLNAI